MSYAYSSLLLLVSLAFALYTVVMLLLRGQPDLAAAAALTWFLAAPAVLALGKQQADAAAACMQQAAEAAADATMEITDLEPPTKILSDFHGTWIKVSGCMRNTCMWRAACCAVAEGAQPSACASRRTVHRPYRRRELHLVHSS